MSGLSAMSRRWLMWLLSFRGGSAGGALLGGTTGGGVAGLGNTGRMWTARTRVTCGIRSCAGLATTRLRMVGRDVDR